MTRMKPPGFTHRPCLTWKKKHTERTEQWALNTYIAAAAEPATKIKRLGNEDPMRRFGCWRELTLNNNYCYYTWINNGHCDKFKRKYIGILWKRGQYENSASDSSILNNECMNFVVGNEANDCEEVGPWFFNALISLLKHRRNIVIFECRSIQMDEWFWMRCK